MSDPRPELNYYESKILCLSSPSFIFHVFSFGMSLDSLLGPEAKQEDIITRKQHTRPILDAPESSLSPIEIKVEENSAASVIDFVLLCILVFCF